ncbi:MAG: hypothetical protein LC635_01505 [Pseudonocardiaceae bacterium]|nr:hypothetical protein [Pseudonocardiaceae bacterium]
MADQFQNPSDPPPSNLGSQQAEAAAKAKAEADERAKAEAAAKAKADEKKKPRRGFGKPKLAGTVLHKGREHHAGDEVPEGCDVDRLKRLGLIEGHEPDTDDA